MRVCLGKISPLAKYLNMISTGTAITECMCDQCIQLTELGEYNQENSFVLFPTTVPVTSRRYDMVNLQLLLFEDRSLIRLKSNSVNLSFTNLKVKKGYLPGSEDPSLPANC